MSRIENYGKKTNKAKSGKKGFTLVELLVAVTVLAVLLPALLQIFIFSSRLNRKANLQGRADQLAESTMEEIKKVDFEKLKTWLDDNGWTTTENNETDENSEVIYKAVKESDGGERKLSFTLSKYLNADNSEKYKAGVPKFPGTDTKDINIGNKETLGNEQNRLAVDEMAARLNVNSALKQRIWNSISTQILQSNPGHTFDSSRMTLTNNGQTITSDDLVKKTTIEISYNLAHTTISAKYNVVFEYDLAQCEYTYLYYDENGRFKSLKGTYAPATPEKIQESFSSGTIDKAYNGTYPEKQNLFISYTPLNENDEVTIIPPDDKTTNIIFEENYITGNTSYVLKKASFVGCSIEKFIDGSGSYAILKNGAANVAFFSSNNSALDAPLSESVYQDEVKIWLYKAEVMAEVKNSASDESGTKASFTSTMFR